MALVASVAFGLGIATAFPESSHADEYCQATPRPVASVLLIHGGAWSMGSAAMERDLCAALARMGFRARSLEYPLGTVPGSIAYADEATKQEAGRGRPVYAAGYSAGASVAEYLAVKARIDGAVAVAPLSDFVNWMPPSPDFWDSLGMTPAMRLRFSPLHNIEDPAPIRIVHSPQDDVVPYEQSVRMVAACGRRCELVTLKLGLGHASIGSRGPLLQWFAKRATGLDGAASRHDAPVISFARMRPRRLAVRPAATRGRPGRGSILTYQLSEPARVAFSIERESPGNGRRQCLWQPERARGNARCSGLRRVGGFDTAGSLGGNRTYVSGMIRGKALRRGRYRATLVAESASGRRSQPRSLFFTVVD